MATIGKVHDVPKELNFEWRINDFFSLSEKVGESYSSPSFLLAGEFWYFRIYPNGKSEIYSGFVSVFLMRKLKKPTISMEWSFSLKSCDKKRIHESTHKYAFDTSGNGCGAGEFLERSMLSEKKSELVPSGSLTIICTVESYSKSTDDAGKLFAK